MKQKNEAPKLLDDDRLESKELNLLNSIIEDESFFDDVLNEVSIIFVCFFNLYDH